MARLGDSDLRAALGRLDGWQGGTDTIRKTFQFEDFMGSIGFVNRAAELAEAANHHPDIDIRWNKVTMTLSTHDEGGVSDKDVDLAGKLNSAAQG
jgi:4a-hydroxytetrahydrobiopterin dehydratase